MILRVLGAIAPPLILAAVMRALIGAKVRGRLAGKMFFLLALNTVVAILIGLTVANAIQPGRHASLPAGEAPTLTGNPLTQLLDNIPASLMRPLVDNNVIGVIIIAVAFGIAARRLPAGRRQQVLDALEIGFDLILIVLHWVIALVPLAVFCKVAFVVGTEGFRPFLALGWFIVTVIVALAGNVLPDTHPDRVVGAAAPSDPRHARRSGHGVFYRKFHSDDAGYIREPARESGAA